MGQREISPAAAPPSAGGDPDQVRRRLEGVIASAMDAIVSIDQQQRIVLFNPSAESIFGLSAAEVIGHDLSELLPERHQAAHEAHVRHFLREGPVNQEMRSLQPARTITGRRASGEEFPMEASISQIDVGGAKFATVILRDISERVADEEARDLLAREVDHRAKNALSVVQALVSLTRAASKDEFVEAVRARITALARTHSLLAKNRWSGADLRQILEDETAPYLPQRIRISGPSVTLRANAVEPFGLIVHELATNAVKYGALSVAGGHVDLTVAVLPGEELQLHWRETGGPAAATPTSSGFGFTMIERLVTRQLGGRIEIAWPARGLQVVATFPAAVHRTDDGLKRPPQAARLPAWTPGNTKRVLLVEDEPLVALELADQLSELGWEVVGPAATIEEAARLLDQGDLPDVAVLDINLRGRLVYPIADRLRSKGVPLVFCTGYEQVDVRYRDCPIVRKPVNIDLLDAQLRQLGQSGSTQAGQRPAASE